MKPIQGAKAYRYDKARKDMHAEDRKGQGCWRINAQQ